MCVPGRFAGNKILSPAVAWVNWENKDSWKWFLENVAEFENGLLEKIVNREGNVIFSDDDKGTRDAAAIIFPNAFLAMCAQHLKSRALLISIGCESAFWDCVKPLTMSEFQRNFNKLKSDFPAVHKYLLEKEPKRWARAHMTHLRTFGLMTNNLAEQHNKLMKDGGRTGQCSGPS